MKAKGGLARGLILASHPEPGLAVTVIAVALAASSGRDARGILAVGLAVGTGQLSVGWHNDWLDALRDRRAGRADKPVARDAVPRSVVGAAAGVALAACVPLSLWSGWRAGSVHLAAVALAWAYNGGLKATVWSWVPYAGAFALLVSFVSLGLPGSPWPPWWGAAAGALLGTGAHLVNAATDIDDDRATGVRGLPLRLGYRRSVGLAALLLLAASVLIAVGPRHLGWPVLGLPVAVALVAVGLSGPSRPGSRRLFRVAIGVALVDAAMLVAQGHRL
jgi:protoheme IX farnesyltransferase